MLTQSPALVIFDKDGTLIDFQQMWGRWAKQFAARVSDAITHDVNATIASVFGYDQATTYIDPRGPLAIASMARMQQMAVEVIRPFCASIPDAYHIVQSAWQPPDPTRDVIPLADLNALFTQIQACGALIAIATADNRAPTLATMEALGVHGFIVAVACADDPGVAAKPAPDKIYAICRELSIAPHHAIMIGDTPADMQMGQNAGVMAQIGVTSGLSTHTDLAPYATWVMPTIAHLVDYWPTR